MKKGLFLLLSSLFLPLVLIPALISTALFITMYCCMLPIFILGGTLRYGSDLVKELNDYIFQENDHQRHVINHQNKRIAVHLLLGLVILPLASVPIAIVSVLLIPVMPLVMLFGLTGQFAAKLAGKLMQNPFNEKTPPAHPSSYQQMSALNPSSEPHCKSTRQKLKDLPHTLLFCKRKAETFEIDNDLEIIASIRFD